MIGVGDRGLFFGIVHSVHCAEGPHPDMGRIEKTVFLSYRRTNAPWALAIFQDLTYHGYDVFFDFNGIASGDFEGVIVENIRDRAHFIVLLTPSALERCNEPGDWLRREIETALDDKRNIVPIMLDGFSFDTPGIASELTGKLAVLRSYNALLVSVEYFPEAMERLRGKFINVPLDAVRHPASVMAAEAAKAQQAAAVAAPAVTPRELTAQEWFERGTAATDPEEKMSFYSMAIHLQPDYARAFYNRGIVRHNKGDLEGALKDYDEAIRLTPRFASAFTNRGNTRKAKGNLKGALDDYTEAIRLDPNATRAYSGRALVRDEQGDFPGAVQDYGEAIRLKPNFALAFYNRAIAREAAGDLEGALGDYSEAIRLKPDDADSFYNRGLLWQAKNNLAAAIADYQQFLDLGGGSADGSREKTEQLIQDLRTKL